MLDFDIIKELRYFLDINISTLIKEVLVAYYELNQLADYKGRYSEEPVGKSKEYMDNYNYNKELDGKRTIFDEEALNNMLLNGLVGIMCMLCKEAAQKKDINFIQLNKMLKDSANNNKKKNISMWNPEMALAELRHYFTSTHDFIPKIISEDLLEQIFKCILNLCDQFELSFNKALEEYINRFSY